MNTAVSVLPIEFLEACERELTLRQANEPGITSSIVRIISSYGNLGQCFVELSSGDVWLIDLDSVINIEGGARAYRRYYNKKAAEAETATEARRICARTPSTKSLRITPLHCNENKVSVEYFSTSGVKSFWNQEFTEKTTYRASKYITLPSLR